MPELIRESGTAGELTGSRQLCTLITPGWGASGYYSAAVLEQAAKDLVFPKNTQSHIDHDGEMARFEQPVGSVKNLAAALAENAWWDPEWVHPDTGVKGRLAAESNVFPRWREDLKAMKEVIGMSIVAGATIKQGEAEGRKGPIVEKLHPNLLNRVDYVTNAGRGGHISEIRESANGTVDEAVATDIEQWLSQAIRDAYRTEDRWVYVDAHDETFVYFRDNGKLMRQAYTLDGVNVTLLGEPVEVRRRTEYDPDNQATEAITPVPQDSLPTPAKVTEKAKSKETPNMAEVQIEEARLRTLEDSHGRVPALEADLTRTQGENTELREGLARARALNRAQEFARTIVSSANADLSESVVARIVAASVSENSLPLTEALQLDTDALTETVAAARESEETYLAKLAKENGLGQVRGIGATEATETAAASDADIREAMKGAK